MRYDSVIVGTGPAGLEAAINLKIRNKSFLLIGPKDLSPKLTKAPEINNYLGMGKVSGTEMAEKFKEHLNVMDIEVSPQRVTAIYHMGEYFSIATTESLIESTTLILATGVHSASKLKGEDEYLGRGIGYCATCDAPLYKGKKVAILGFNKESEEEANYVSELAGEVIFIPAGITPSILNDSIKVVEGRPQEFRGGMKADKLVMDTVTVEADGFFILRDSIAPSTLLPGLEVDGAHIKVDANMQTNIEGCFAAGDCVGMPYQYIKAAGQGLVAAVSAVKFLAKKNSKI